MEYRLTILPCADKKALSAAGYTVAKELLAEKLCIATSELCFSKTVLGKPYLPNCEWQFNISHSGDAVLCGIHNGAIGVDIEKARPYNDRVAKRICSPAEYAYISKDPSRFLEIWTRKEAYAKLIGKGLSISLRTIEVASDTTLHKAINGCQVLTTVEKDYVYSVIWG